MGCPMFHAHLGSRSRSLKQSGHWVFEKGGRLARIISTLKALAVLLLLNFLHVKIPSAHRIRALVAPTWTDKTGQRSCSEQAHDHECSRECGNLWSLACMKKMLLKADSLADGVHDSFDQALRDRPQLPHLGTTFTGTRSGTSR